MLTRGSRPVARTLLVLSVVLGSLVLTGCGGGNPPKQTLGNDMVEHIDVATQSGDFHTPLDSTPDSDATTIYFTATGPRGPGIFRVPAAGGAVTELVAGAPLVAPTGIAISSDGQQIYVADPQAGGATGKAGQIFVVPTGGGSPAALPGSEGTAPRGMDVVSEGGQNMIYFTGKDPRDGQAGVFKLPAAGGSAPSVVVKGAPLVDPDGVTVTRAGVVYVADRAAAGTGMGSVFKISGTTVTKIVDKVRTGNPAGVALTLDETVLLVSALQPDRESDQVLLIDLGTLQTGSITKVIEQNQKAGGVHRARNRNVFSWADSTAGPSGGKVFVIR